MIGVFVRVFSALVFLIAAGYLLTFGTEIMSGEDDMAILFVYVTLAALVSSVVTFGYSFVRKGKVNE